MVAYNLQGGAVVSGSFQGFDQTYLIDALSFLGASFVGVTQLPASVSDDALIDLDQRGVRTLRFNLQRGGSEGLDQLERFACRVHKCVGWHVELYAELLTFAGVRLSDHEPAMCIGGSSWIVQGWLADPSRSCGAWRSRKGHWVWTGGL